MQKGFVLTVFLIGVLVVLLIIIAAVSFYFSGGINIMQSNTGERFLKINLGLKKPF